MDIDGGRSDDIAIVGMACKYPGARDLDAYWENLKNGVESIRFAGDEELLAIGVTAEELAHPDYVRAAAIVDDMEWFDGAFFDFTPKEADVRDPQQRLFLETSYLALQHAACDPATFDGSIGVYGGVFTNRYAWLNVRRNRQIMDALGSLAAEISNHSDYLSTLVSYKLDLRGPSLTVATACSTSMVATHLACQALRNGECDVALAGGVEVELPYGHGYIWQEGGIFSRDGHCRAFDAGASGTIFGSGVGVVVLKRVADAIADRDWIHAVIRGTAINNDGSKKVGFTAPGLEGQMQLVAETYGVSGIDPRTVTYVEAHGTGTAVGDPIEVTALSRVFQADTTDTGWCGIGSVKTNIGHMGPAAGVAGLIKATLALEHRQIPPSLHFEEPNPRIDFESSPFRVVTELTDWDPTELPRRAGVSSFGIGGTNGHVILEEAPPRPARRPSAPTQLLLLSASTPSALESSSARLADHLRDRPEIDLADVAHTLRVGRTALRHRRAVVCAGAAEAAAVLADPRKGVTGAREARPAQVAFMFPGQGSQHPGMARELYEREAVFREEVDRCAELLRPHLGLDVRDLIYPAGDPAEAAAQLQQTSITQPAVFVVEYALARLLMDRGVEPQAMIGHSIGEYVAATLAGVFSLEDALGLVAARGALMQGLPPGAMLAMPLTEPVVTGLISGADLSLAAVNAPSLCVVSGPAEAVDELEADLDQQGMTCTRLRTSHAFHSAMMDPILDRFTELVGRVDRRAPELPFVSNLTGTWITPEEATDPVYWAKHLRGTVRFADGVREVIEGGSSVLIDVGPGQSLSGLARQHPAAEGATILPSLRHPQRPASDHGVLLSALGHLWTMGAPVELPADDDGMRVPLPGYPFERRRHWVDADPAVAQRAAERYPVPLGTKLPLDGSYAQPVWNQVVPARTMPVPGEHSPWLILADADGLGSDLATALRAAGETVVVALPGGELTQLDDDTYAFDPRDPGQYDQLLGAVSHREAPRSIVHMLTVTEPDPERPEIVVAHEDEANGFHSLCSLATALAMRQDWPPLRIVVVSTNMHEITGGDGMAPAKATLLGPCSVMPKELLSEVTCRSVDFAWPASAAARARMVAQLESELVGSGSEEVVAFRGHRRWVRDYEVVRLERAADYASRLRERGVYLLTGGLGAVGLTYARHLADTVRARLALVGRSGFPGPETWDAWLNEHPADDRTSGQIRALREIEEVGGEVAVFSADVADLDDMRRVLRDVHARFGQVNGVIHAAGLSGGGMVALKGREAAASVLRPKVDGTLTLNALLRDEPLDFFVLCSSIVGVSGDFGLFDYCAANAFLDAFANREGFAGGPVLAINFPAWHEIGMAVDAAAGLSPYQLLQSAQARPVTSTPLLHRRLEDGDGLITYSSDFTPTSHWMLDEHRIDGRGVVPGVGYLELVRAAAADAMGEGPFEIRDVVFLAPLDVGSRREVRVVLRPEAEQTGFVVCARSGEGWTDYATGSIRRLEDEPARSHDVEAIRGRCTAGEVRFTVADHRGVVVVGPHWDNVERVLQGEREELALLRLPEPFLDETAAYGLHPALLDGATSFAQTLGPTEGDYLPFGYGSVRVRASLPARFLSHIRHRGDTSGGQFMTCDITLLDETGAELVDIEGFTLRRVDGQAVVSGMAGQASGPAEAEPTAADPGPAAGESRGPQELEFGISTREAVEAFRAILGSWPGPQVVLCREGVHRKIERMREMTQRYLLQQIAEARVPIVVQTERSLAVPLVEPETDLERTLVTLWQETLGVSPIGVEDPFFELGGNSLIAVQLASRIRERFQIALALPSIFEQPTIRSLAVLIEDTLVEKVSAMSEEEARAMLAKIIG